MVAGLWLEYGFLLARYVDEATLERACRLAERSGVHPHHVLIANGWLKEADCGQAAFGFAALVT